MQVTDYITPNRILSDMQSTSKESALVELADLVANGQGTAMREQVQRVLAERERLASTGIGEEIAIPHGKLNAVGDLVMAVARSKRGVDFESVDGKLTRLFFVLLAPESSTGMHLKALARISRLCREPGFRAQLLEANDSREMFDILIREDGRFKVR